MKIENRAYSLSKSQLQQLDKAENLEALNLFGVNISGIDPRLVKEAQIFINIPMKAGHAKVIGVDKDAKINIAQDCVAVLKLRLIRNEGMALALDFFSLEFSEPLKIKNPAASLQPRAKKNMVGTAIKDKIADVKIKNISINHEGQILIDGQVNLLHMMKKRLPPVAGQLDISALDEQALAMLGLGETPNKISVIGEKFNINKLFANINATCERASYELSIKGDEAQASFLKDNTFIQGEKAPLNIKMAGYADVNKSGDLRIKIDGHQSKISSSLGNFVPDIDTHITQAHEQGIKVHVVGSLCGKAHGLSIDTFSDKEVKSVMPRRRQGPLTPITPVSDDDFNLSCGAKSVDLQSQIDVTAEFNKGLQKIGGAGQVKLKAREPFAKTHERGIILGGDVSAKVQVEKFTYDMSKGLSDTLVHAKFGVHPNERTRKHYPEIRPVEYKYKAEIAGSKEAIITPPPFGLSRLVRPVKNYEGHDERVDTALTNTNFQPIGSKEYFTHVAKITGAKPRQADQVELLIDGIRSMPKRMELINNAKKLICFQTLVFKNDASGWQYAQALVAAAKRGVRVVGVIDAIGNIESLRDLTEPNALYQYMRDNKIELRLYNGFLEDGMRKILSVAQRYPGVFSNYGAKSLLGIAEVLRFFEQVADVATNDTNALPRPVRVELQNAIHSLLNGQEGVSPHNSVQELKHILSGNMTTFDELLLAIKRIGDVSYRWHEKYLVIDGDQAIVGGMNIADEYLHGGSGEIIYIKNKAQPAWRDSDVYLSGEVVKEVFKSFKQNWFHVAQEHLDLAIPKTHKNSGKENNYTVSIIQHRPLPDGDHNVTNFLLYNLRTLKAGEKAWFETAYFLPRGVLRSLQKEMVAAAKRGVDVRILTNSETTSDFGPLVEAAVFDTRELIKAGARVFHRNHDRMVHAKVSVLGEKLTMIGSWNMDNRSASHDSEDVCVIYDSGITKQMTEQLITDMFEQSDEITLAAIEKRPLAQELRSAGMLLMGELA
jgi:phosphatidylserine/phosphatidylglycerophosphate/cardiolipin synthase-like enzyme